MPVGELLARISAAELTEWQAYEDLAGPLDAGRRTDVGVGVVAATIANANRDKKAKRYKPDDFMPKWGSRRRRTQSWQEQLAVVEQLNGMLGGKDRRRQPQKGR